MKTDGLFTQIWGASMWESLHCISFNFPHEPTDDDKKKYYNYFMSVGDVLPCCICKEHYIKYVNNDKTKLNIDVLQNRNSLTLWLYNFHKYVSKRIGFDYAMTYKIMCDKYNSYIATCDFTKEQKKIAYMNMYNTHAPVVKYKYLKYFVSYANMRKFLDFENKIKYYYSLDKTGNDWIKRNELCCKQLKHIRIGGLPTIETDGKYKNLPTEDELKLMQYISTSNDKITIKNMIILIKILGLIL